MNPNTTRSAIRFWGAAFAALLTFAATRPAAAHDFWIEPVAGPLAAPGASVPLRLRVGQDWAGDAELNNPERIDRFVVAGPSGERAVGGIPGDDPAGTFVLPGPGLYTALYQSRFSQTRFDAFAKFEDYLKSAGLEHALPLARFRAGGGGTIVEDFMRCAKTLVAGPGAAQAAADHRFGCPLELVASTNPLASGQLELRLLWKGKPLEGALVALSNRAAPQARLQARTDRDGRVAFHLDRPGAWMATAVQIAPAPRFARADWQSWWASLTFELPAR